MKRRSFLQPTSKTGVLGQKRRISGSHIALQLRRDFGLPIEKQSNTTSDLKVKIIYHKRREEGKGWMNGGLRKKGREKKKVFIIIYVIVRFHQPRQHHSALWWMAFLTNRFHLVHFLFSPCRCDMKAILPPYGLSFKKELFVNCLRSATKNKIKLETEN